MKKIISLFFIFIYFTSNSQIINNGSYILDPIPYTFADAGTNSFTHSVPAPGYGCGGSFNYKLFRYDGYWYILETSSACGSFLQNRTLLQSFTTNPPCSAMWHSRFAGLTVSSWTPFLPVTSPNHPTINTTSIPNLQSILGSTCTPAPSILSSTLTPFYLLPPSLTTTAILAIASPPTGALVWDITAGCLKVFNGTAWVCL